MKEREKDFRAGRQSTVSQQWHVDTTTYYKPNVIRRDRGGVCLLKKGEQAPVLEDSVLVVWAVVERREELSHAF